MKKLLCVLLSAALLIACLVGCGSKTQSASASSETQASAALPGEGETYCVIMSLGQLEFFDALKAGVCDAANEMGAKWYFSGPQEFVPDQIVQAIDQAVANKVTGIVLHGQTEETADAVNNAIAAGIPVICVNTDIPSNRLSFIGCDPYNAGVGQANEMIKLLNGKTGTAAIYVTPGKAYSVKITGSDDTKLLLNSEQSISIFKNLAPTAVEYKSTAAANTAEITAPAEIEASTAANYDVQVYADSKAFGTPVATAALATTADLTATLAGRQYVSAVCSLKAWAVAAATTGSSFIVDSEAVASKAAPVSNENDAKGTFRTGSVPAVTDIAGKIVQSGDKLIITAKIDTADPLYGHIKQYVLSLFKQGTTTTTATVYGTEDNGIVTFDVTTVADNAALETGVYNVTIATVSDDAMLYAGNSAAKSDISYTKNNVTGLTVTLGTTDGTAVWTGAATGYTDDTFTYTVRVYQKSGLVTGLNVTSWTGVDLNGDADGIDLKTTDTTVTIPGFTAGTSYKVLVTAQSKYNMEYAAETESIGIYKATAPTQAVLNDDGIVSWTAQTGASSYTATVKGSVSGLENTVADLGAATYSLIDDTTLNVLAQNAQAYSIVITTIGDEADENTDSIFILNSDATAALNIKDGAVNRTKNTTGIAHPGYLPDVTSVSTEITVSGNDRIVSGHVETVVLMSRVKE